MLLPFLLLFSFLTSVVSPFGLGSSQTKALYSSSDPGIILLNATNIASSVLHSQTGWMVEFYSSWCGHCIHFAPTYKELAKDVKDWNSVLRVGAIDCADDANMATCRQYEIMGYPSLKFFPPGAADGELGEQRSSPNKDIEVIKADMHDWVAKARMNESLSQWTKAWPVMEGFSSNDLSSLWSSSSLSNSPFSLLLLHKASDLFPALDVLLDASELTSRTPFIIRHINSDSAPSELLTKLGARKFPSLISVAKDGQQAKVLYEAEGGKFERGEIVKAAREFVWQESGAFSGKGKESAHQESKEVEQKKNEIMPHATHSEGEIKRRRYTTHMWDLEQALSYALSHEASGHASISGEALVALQEFTDVLARTFPARPRVKKLLDDLRLFVLDHTDVLRGEDLGAHIEALKGDTSAFKELGDSTPEWIGCKGSAGNYGGYPCGLWTLFHTLTVMEKKDSSTAASPALSAIASYVHHFFGCRECARHFSQAIDASPISEVAPGSEAVMWLWRTHNKVNLRLSGDLADDPVFPKEPFPNRQHCTDCYTGRIAGSDLTSEYKLSSVERFMRLLYTDIDLSGLDTALDDEETEDSEEVLPPARSRFGGQKQRPHNDLMVVEEHKNAYLREENLPTSSFMSPSDTRLSVFIYLLSAILLAVGYYKFVARRRLGCSRFWGRSRSGSPYNPLHGKV